MSKDDPDRFRKLREALCLLKDTKFHVVSQDEFDRLQFSSKISLFRKRRREENAMMEVSKPDIEKALNWIENTTFANAYGDSASGDECTDIIISVLTDALKKSENA